LAALTPTIPIGQLFSRAAFSRFEVSAFEIGDGEQGGLGDIIRDVEQVGYFLFVTKV
jgi:hypothetical protein